MEWSLQNRKVIISRGIAIEILQYLKMIFMVKNNKCYQSQTVQYFL